MMLMSLDIDKLAPTEDTAGIELIGIAETAKTAELEAQEARAEGKARCGGDTAPKNDAAEATPEDERALGVPLQGATTECERAHNAARRPDSTEASTRSPSVAASRDTVSCPHRRSVCVPCTSQSGVCSRSVGSPHVGAARPCLRTVGAICSSASATLWAAATIAREHERGWARATQRGDST